MAEVTHIPLFSDQFLKILRETSSFHDAEVGFGELRESGEVLIFVSQIYFGPTLKYNPGSIIGGVFWIEGQNSKCKKDIEGIWWKSIIKVNINHSESEISFRLENETVTFDVGGASNFQFILSQDPKEGIKLD